MPSIRSYMEAEEKTSQAVTFQQGLEFIEKNHEADHWFLQIETLIPMNRSIHLKEDKALYPIPFFGRCGRGSRLAALRADIRGENTIQHVRYEYAALLSKCDRYLGKVLDIDIEYHLWDDTMLIVNTDHGFLLGEHGWWGRPACQSERLPHSALYLRSAPKRMRRGQGRRNRSDYRLSQRSWTFSVWNSEGHGRKAAYRRDGFG